MSAECMNSSECVLLLQNIQRDKEQPRNIMFYSNYFVADSIMIVLLL